MDGKIILTQPLALFLTDALIYFGLMCVGGAHGSAIQTVGSMAPP